MTFWRTNLLSFHELKSCSNVLRFTFKFLKLSRWISKNVKFILIFSSESRKKIINFKTKNNVKIPFPQPTSKIFKHFSDSPLFPNIFPTYLKHGFILLSSFSKNLVKIFKLTGEIAWTFFRLKRFNEIT